MNGRSLASWPCRRAEGQADNCPPPGPSEHWLNQGGEAVISWVFIWLLLVCVQLHMHTAVQLYTALMFVYSVQSVLYCVISVHFVLFVLLYNTNVYRCTNKPVFTATVVKWQVGNSIFNIFIGRMTDGWRTDDWQMDEGQRTDSVMEVPCACCCWVCWPDPPCPMRTKRVAHAFPARVFKTKFASFPASQLAYEVI